MKKQRSKQIIIVLGPTGSGKTALAEKLAVDLDGEIINADMGQFYSPLSIGTAKPDYKKTPFKQHLFDICDDPVDFNVKEYRSLVLKTIDDIHKRGKRAIIVGGSLFYVKSLFYPPREFATEAEIKSQKESTSDQFDGMSNEDLWTRLFVVDPVRAEAIHVNDRYRLERSLTLFFETGRLPSECKPYFQKPFDSFIVWIEVDKLLLKDRIARRMKIMLDAGWIEEVEKQNDDQWYDFYSRKGLIGYKAIADWIRDGKKESELVVLEEFLIRSTCLYAKRQKTFWKPFLSMLKKEDNLNQLAEEQFFTFKNKKGSEEYQTLRSLVR